MEEVEIEREMWRIAKLSDEIRTVERHVLFLESVHRYDIDQNRDTSAVHKGMTRCLDALGLLIIERDTAEQQVRAYVRASREMQEGRWLF